MNSIKEFFDQLLLGNGSIITQENIYWLNQRALEIYNIPELDQSTIEELKYLIMCCNILYNRTDMKVQVIEDGFYDLLLEKYKVYDNNFQVGSAVVDFKSFVEHDPTTSQRVAICPIIIDDPPVKDEFHQEVYDKIIEKGKFFKDKRDFSISPIEFDSSRLSKGTHDTEHNHPSLIGTLDKAKFVMTNDAMEAGVLDDPNVKILERDFFMNHIQKGIYPPNRKIKVVVELKYDGISVEADCGLQVYSARTRGDTGIGKAVDLTPILEGYPFKHAGAMIGEKPIGVKFEAIITKTDLEKFCKLRDKSYSNGRTAIIGLFGASDAYLFRDLITLVPLAIDRDDVPQISNRMEEIELLNQLFISHGEPLRYCYFEGTVSEVLYCIKAFWDEAMIARDYLNFMYDGIVVSYIDEDIRQALGRENYINKFSMAVKFDPLQKQTIFRGYTYEVGQHGQITPMIHYDPVEFLGTIHTKSTGSSLNRFRLLGLKYGDYIDVTYRNDVMPYVSRCECDHNRKNPNPVIEFPTICPICGSNLITSESGDSAICPNQECPGRSTQRMVNMLAKMNIKGFSDASIIALGVTHLYELFTMDEESLKRKLGEANGSKLYQILYRLITKQDKIKDYIVMGALGFTSMAYKKWEAIFNFTKIEDLYKAYLNCKVESEFEAILYQYIPTIGTVTAHTIAKEFPFFEKDILFILQNFDIENTFGRSVQNKGQIRFTGIRNKQLSELLCNAGYDADDSSSAGKKTDILLVPYEGFSSSKVSKVSENCKIIPIQEFIDHMDQYIGEKLM